MNKNLSNDGRKILPPSEDATLLALRKRIHHDLLEDFLDYIDLCRSKMRAEDLSDRIKKLDSQEKSD